MGKGWCLGRKCLFGNVFVPYTDADMDLLFDNSLDLGVRALAMELSWPSIEATQGNFDFVSGNHDLLFARAHEAGVEIVGIPTRSPAWANGGDSFVFGPPVDMVNWGRFIWKLVRRYMPQGDFAREQGWSAADPFGLRFLHAWNQPNLEGRWKKWHAASSTFVGRPSADEYAAMLAMTAKWGRAANPDIYIIGGNLTKGGDPVQQFLIDMLDVGALDNMDALSLLPWDGGGPLSDATDRVRLVRDRLNIVGGKKTPIWIVEGGVDAGEDADLKIAQAAWMKDGFNNVLPLWHETLGVDAWFFDSLIDGGQGTGLVRNAGTKREPAFTTFQTEIE